MSSRRFDLAGHVIIVTGGGIGIGKVYAQELARAGAHVVIADIAGEAGEAVAAGINASNGGGSAIAVATDISGEAAARAMAAAAMDAFGRIDGLVNNASLMSTLARRPWHEIPVDEWDRVMAVNLRGQFLCCRAVWPQMKAQGRGRIVNISSTRFLQGTPNRLHYSASKAGVIGFTRSLARELGPDGITCNAIMPGFTESETQMASSDPGYLAGTAAKYQRRSIQRPQLPEDLVGTVMFLLSDASAFITGQTINVDGGESMH